MDVCASCGVSAIANATTNQPASVAVLKKTLDAQANAAAALIESLPTPPKPVSNLPEHVGRHINTQA